MRAPCFRPAGQYVCARPVSCDAAAAEWESSLERYRRTAHFRAAPYDHVNPLNGDVFPPAPGMLNPGGLHTLTEGHLTLTKCVAHAIGRVELLRKPPRSGVMVLMKSRNTMSLDTVATLALGMLYAGQNPGVKVSTHVFELEGHTVIVAHRLLTVSNAIGATKRIGL